MKRLQVLLHDQRIGVVAQAPSGRLAFVYDEAWRHGPWQMPLSLSMPLALATHGHAVVSAFLWNLLPDNEQVLHRWGQRFQCPARNPVALLAAVGEDCVGAVRFLPDETVASRSAHDAVVWLDEREIGRRLRELRRDAAAGRRVGDPGRFTLPGTQAKTALHWDGARWGVPAGRVPTTPILKAPLPGLDGHAENEHFCLRLARELGLNAATTHVHAFEGEKALVVERYDRFRTATGEVVRAHREDFCQVLGVPPHQKYEPDGGPGVATIIKDILSQSSEDDEDKRRFVAALAFTVLIGGTDAHAKNFSMLLGAERDVRLAPLYDVASRLPHLGPGHLEAQLQKVRTPMRIAGKNRLGGIMPGPWERMAARVGLDPDAVLGVPRDQLARTPDRLAHGAEGCRADGLRHPVIGTLVRRIGQRVQPLRRLYGAAP